MDFDPPLQTATLIRRYKRFLADVHNSQRKYRYSLEAVQVAHGHWVGVNTSRASKLVTEAIFAGKLPQLHGFSALKPEVAFGESRLDLALYYQGCLTTLIEVKNVTLGPASHEPDNGMVSFPDAVTVRGQKHLKELIAVRASGLRAILFFCVQHTGAKAVRPADEVDSHYGQLLREAVRLGVEVWAWKVSLSPERFILTNPLPVLLD